jgi:hypothetical protein
MYVGLIAGTPVVAKLAFSVDLLTLFYHLRRRQPSIGVQGFIKAVCALQQVRFSPCILYPNDDWSSLNIFSRSNSVFRALSMSFATYSADYKKGWMQRSVVSPLLGK